MAEKSKTGVSLTQFLGRVSNADPRDIQAGAFVSQINLQAVRPGALDCRKGVRRMTWTNQTSGGGSHHGIAAYTLRRPDGDIFVVLDSNGVVRGGRGGAAQTSGVSTGIRPPQIGSLSTYIPPSFAMTRDGRLVAVNGLNRPLVWDGQTASMEDGGIDAPSAAPTMATSSAGSNTYYCGYRFIDDHQPEAFCSNLTSLATITGSATSGITYTWTGLSAPATAGQLARVHRVQLFRSTAGQQKVVYLAKTLGCSGTITGITSSAGVSYTITCANHNLAAGAILTITGVTGSGNMPTDLNTTGLVVASVTTNTFTINDATASGTYTSDGTWQLTGYNADAASDTTLAASTALSILNPDGSLNARRFTPPPDFKSVVIMHQDRALYGVDAVYDVGTVTISSGSATVTSSGATFLSTFSGRYLHAVGSVVPYKITAVNTGTNELTVTPVPTESVSGAAYAIRPADNERNQLYYSEIGEVGIGSGIYQMEPESVPAVNVIPIQENTGDDDELRAMIPHPTSAILAKDRHLVALNWVRQPNLDSHTIPLADRGCLSQRCWARYEGVLYLLDSQGPYIFDGGAVQPADDRIHDLFRDDSGVIDFTVRKWFFVCVDPVQELVYFFVSYTADSSTRPKRALVYNIRDRQWWEEKFPVEMGGAALVTISGKLRLVLAGAGNVNYLVGEGTADEIPTALRTTVTSGSTSSTLKGTGFTSDMVGAPVAILSGTAKGQESRISAYTSSTEVSVSPSWSTTPVAGDVALVGAISWSARTGAMALALEESGAQFKRSVAVAYPPTTNDASLDVRFYYDHGTSPETFRFDHSRGGVTFTNGETDAVINLKLARSDKGNAVGREEVPFSGRGEPSIESRRWLSVELRGYQGADRITIEQIDIDGVIA